MDFTTLRTLAFSPTALWIVWGVMFVAWGIMSAILIYHWNSYSTDDPKVRWMKRLYFFVSLLLFASATTFIFSL